MLVEYLDRTKLDVLQDSELLGKATPPTCHKSHLRERQHLGVLPQMALTSSGRGCCTYCAVWLH